MLKSLGAEIARHVGTSSATTPTTNWYPAMSANFNSGYDAYHTNKPNPHPVGSPLYAEWQEGRDQAWFDLQM